MIGQKRKSHATTILSPEDKKRSHEHILKLKSMDLRREDTPFDEYEIEESVDLSAGEITDKIVEEGKEESSSFASENYGN